jgi:hypothetical protein
MINFKTERWSSLSILISAICILAVLYVNFTVALEYASSSGKNRAFFGLTEVIKYFYLVYFIAFSLVSMILAFVAFKHKEKQSYVVVGDRIFTLDCTS